MPKSRPRHRINFLKLLGLAPLVVDAIRAVGIDVEGVTDDASPGGKRVTADEAMALGDALHEHLRPLADGIVRLLVRA